MRRKGYSYIRMSTSEQIKGDSLRRQVEASMAWAAAHDVELAEDLRDIGVSAFRGKNRSEGALRCFLDALEAGKVEPGSILIVESLDRLSRDQINRTLALFLGILESGAEIVTLSDARIYDRDSLNSLGDIITSIVIMSRAHEESSMKSMRGQESWSAKRARARESGRPLTKMGPKWLAWDRGKWVVDAEKGQIVKRMFQMSAQGIGKRKITQILNREKVKSFGHSSHWSDSSVGKILCSRAVLGEYQPQRKIDGRRLDDGLPVKDYYPSVIDEELFYRSAASRRRLKGSGGKRGSHFSNIFQGLVTCGECGSTMRMVNKGRTPKGGRYLVCSNAVKGVCDNRIHFRVRDLEHALLAGEQDIDWRSVGTDDARQSRLDGQCEAARKKSEEARRLVDRYEEQFGTEADDEVATRVAARLRDAIKRQADAETEFRRLGDLVAEERSQSRLVTSEVFARAQEILRSQDYAVRASLNSELRRIWDGLIFYTNYVEEQKDKNGALVLIEEGPGVLLDWKVKFDPLGLGRYFYSVEYMREVATSGREPQPRGEGGQFKSSV